jgi:hypothetical protein
MAELKRSTKHEYLRGKLRQRTLFSRQFIYQIDPKDEMGRKNAPHYTCGITTVMAHGKT